MVNIIKTLNQVAKQSDAERRLSGYDTWRQDTVKGMNRPLDELQCLGRALFNTNSDVGGAGGDLRATVLGNIKWHLYGTKSESILAAANKELELYAERVYIGGLHALSSNIFNELYATGETAIEYPINKERDGVARAVVVLPETLRYKRIKNRYRWYQSLNRHDDKTKRRYFHDVNFKFIPLDPRGDTPRGTSVIMKALKDIWRKEKLTAGEDRILNAMKHLAFVLLNMTEYPDDETLGVDPLDKDYIIKRNQALIDYANSLKNMIEAGNDTGVAITPPNVKGTPFKATTNLTGLNQITQPNNRSIWTGLQSTVFARGDVANVTQALAKILYPLTMAHGEHIIKAVNQQIEFGANLHLKLKGIPIKAVVTREIQPHPFKVDDSTANYKQAQTEELLIDLYGDDIKRQFLEKRGI